jgi:NAD(P)H dehydrogenase (quinone)
MHTIIAYHSDYEHTARVAQAVAAGLAAAGTPQDTVVLRSVLELDVNELIDADVIVFGTPVHMGSMAWQMKQFIDKTSSLWMEAALEGKIAGAFVSCGGFGGAGGGAEHTLIGLHSNALEHGMLMVGFPKSLPGYADAGLQWGLCVRSGNHEGMPTAITDAHLRAARSYGAHLRDTADRMYRV